MPYFPRKKDPKFIAYVAQHPWSPADQRREDKMLANRWRIVRNRMTAAKVGCGGCEGLEWTLLKRAIYAFQGYITAVEAIRRRDEEYEIVLRGLENFEILWAVREKLRDAERSGYGEGGAVA
ncbi:hypothetical protein EXIGLDRAFT_776575 [Exidia glandulosa HHB12029]|uniref:Uncharacterized protein n=1 Tax=Exidia glandulosa HHB12029 TaxID=1314781 RepID=A0A165DF50_EXIGL|nr:hypothetical protein EXIGLDRAFT_776575 [Exidia glandulosa HHB12029]